MTEKQISQPNPFQITNTDRVAYFTAHPDDATMFFAYALDSSSRALQSQGGEPLHGYVASDGEASEKGNREFVTTGGRRLEARAEASYLGVPAQKLHLPSHPDGRLLDHDNLAKLTDDVDEFIGVNGITKAITFDKLGYDGHGDHIATHSAVKEAMSNHPHLEAFTLNPVGEGEIYVPSTDVDKKIGGLALHTSQFRIYPAHAINGNSEGMAQIGSFVLPKDDEKDLSKYSDLWIAETYDVLRAR